MLGEALRASPRGSFRLQFSITKRTFPVLSNQGIRDNVNIYISRKLDAPQYQAVVGLMTP